MATTFTRQFHHPAARVSALSDEVIEAVIRHPERHRLYEAAICAAYTRRLVPGDLAVDGGASIGSHTFPLAAAVGSHGRVIAFEPLRHVALWLKQTLKRRGLANVVVETAALSDRSGRVTFHHVRNHSAYSGLRPRLRYPFEPVFEQLTVPATTLDEALASAERWRFAKLDLEGGEFHALLGGAAAIARHRPLLAFESGRSSSAAAYGYTADDWFGFFDRIGYAVFDLFGHELTPSRWESARTGYNFFAAPRGSADHAFVAEEVPNLLAEGAVRRALTR